MGLTTLAPGPQAGATVHTRTHASTCSPCVFVIPVYNEEDNLPRLLVDLELRAGQLPPGSHVIVVDDGSEDSTPSLVRAYDGALSVELVRLEQNEGPGAAFRSGFVRALELCTDDGVIVTLEGDTTSDLDALPEMLEQAREGADLVLASWKMVNVARRRRLLSSAAGFVVRHALGLDARTVSSFFRVYRASTLRDASALYRGRLIEEPGFACKAELLSKLTRMGAQVAEVTVDLDWSRRVGKSKMPVGRTMLAYWRLLSRERTPQEEMAGV